MNYIKNTKNTKNVVVKIFNNYKTSLKLELNNNRELDKKI